MIKVVTRKGLYALVMNGKRVSMWDHFRLSQYSCYKGKWTFFMFRIKKTTLIIDLNHTDEDILGSFKSNTRNEVRRGMREDIKIEQASVDEFIIFYNDFAKEKSLPFISCADIKKWKTPSSRVMLQKAVGKCGTLSMHANVIDEEEKIANLLYSATRRFDTSLDRKLIGFSNRYLHYVEFLKLRDEGVYTYDFSGVCIDEKDKEKYNIGLFKRGFGGEIKESIALESIPMFIVEKIKSLFS